MKKLLLIHGWDYDNYYGRVTEEAWNNRGKFIEALEKHFIVRRPDLPGFGLEKEPKVKEYTILDYARFIHDYIVKNNYYPDYILGYSFGGAVALTYLKMYGGHEKYILCSPALIRNHNNSKKYMKTPKILDPIRNKIRDFYLIHKVKVPEMVYGTKFLRNTYQSIVRVEITSYLEEINPKQFIIIYGEQDDMVDPNRMVNLVSDKVLKRIHFIKGGGHDIANTHTQEIVNLILDFDKENGKKDKSCQKLQK